MRDSRDPLSRARGLRRHSLSPGEGPRGARLSPLGRGAGHIAGHYRDGDGGGRVAGGNVVVLRRWLLEEEPREDHRVAHSIWSREHWLQAPADERD